MKKILILLLLFIPLFANAQDWFKANAIRYAVDGSEFSEWQRCNISVFFEGGTKVKIYATDTHTLRRTKDATEDIDEHGISYVFWQGVDEKGEDCIVCIKSDQKNFIHLMITYIKENLVICYNLIPDK